ncbi:Low-density lipoprotein receptor-related protein 2 [Chionoecetes opilio]|uniref:Low-density lipoprotein receptor-related protein 2 n=1 Tax=Chionoecetes opilio TaxID=41210 RepID=A0A8J4Y524_CHIOP|nr:Low-density lipoprotein receptor-related protein 2 [Chionoecetes opilio]
MGVTRKTASPMSSAVTKICSGVRLHRHPAYTSEFAVCRVERQTREIMRLAAESGRGKGVVFTFVKAILAAESATSLPGIPAWEGTHWKTISHPSLVRAWVCDKDPDCTDESDERNCNGTCGAEYFQCGNGQCIVNMWVCNGENDCADNSDEEEAMCANHTCLPGRFRCLHTHKCIYDGFVCDGSQHCSDGSDEEVEVCKCVCV